MSDKQIEHDVIEAYTLKHGDYIPTPLKMPESERGFTFEEFAKLNGFTNSGMDYGADQTLEPMGLLYFRIFKDHGRYLFTMYIDGEMEFLVCETFVDCIAFLKDLGPLLELSNKLNDRRDQEDHVGHLRSINNGESPKFIKHCLPCQELRLRNRLIDLLPLQNDLVNRIPL